MQKKEGLKPSFFCGKRGIRTPDEFNFIVCLTKADKLSRTQQARQSAAIKKQLNVPAENVIITSSQTGTGIDELKRRIAEACL